MRIRWFGSDKKNLDFQQAPVAPLKRAEGKFGLLKVGLARLKRLFIRTKKQSKPPGFPNSFNKRHVKKQPASKPFLAKDTNPPTIPDKLERLELEKMEK